MRAVWKFTANGYALTYRTRVWPRYASLSSRTPVPCRAAWVHSQLDLDQIPAPTQMTQVITNLLTPLAVVVSVAQSCLTLCDPWTVAHQAPLSIEFFRQEYWSGLPFPSPGNLPDSGIKPRSSAFSGGFFTTVPRGHLYIYTILLKCGQWWKILHWLNDFTNSIKVCLFSWQIT